MAHIRRTRHYAEQTAAAFPLLKKQAVVTTCIRFMQLLHESLVRGHEVLIQRQGPGVAPLMLKIYRENFNVDAANARALLLGRRLQRLRRLRERRRRIRRDLGLGPAPDLTEHLFS